MAIVGFDTGSVSVSMVVLDENRAVVMKKYASHNGKVIETIRSFLSDLPLASGYISATDSSHVAIKAHRRYHAVMAEVRTLKERQPDARAMISAGGEKFYLTAFHPDGRYKSTKSNPSCAAGTGCFLDQQAGRLGFNHITRLCDMALSNTRRPLPIATRCAVFAKTDLIHAQQEGCSVPGICAGLCQGVAKNIADTLFSAAKPEGKVVMCGGVALNTAVVRYLEEQLNSRVEIDEFACFYGAMGAALLLADDLASGKKGAIFPAEELTEGSIILNKKVENPATCNPLTFNNPDYPDFSAVERWLYTTSNPNRPGAGVEVESHQTVRGDNTISVVLGLDIGATSTKAALMDGGRNVMAGFYTRTAADPVGAVCGVFEAIADFIRRKNMTLHVAGFATTGSGRKLIGALMGADASPDEITAHARAAVHIDPAVDTIIEIGGQDAKFTAIKNGMVSFARMNNACAAGTGSLIEDLAAQYNCPIDQISCLVEGVRAPLSSDRCAVFLERDITHLLNSGFNVAEALASAIHSVRENYLNKVAIKSAIGENISFQGATAKNRALVAAFEQKLQKTIKVTLYCHLAGAIGAALLLMDEKKMETRFSGLAIYDQKIPLTSEVCNLCTNHCQLTLAEVNGTTVAFGCSCGRDYNTKAHLKKADNGLDGVKKRRELKDKCFQRNPSLFNEITIGIPSALHVYDDLEFWQGFFTLLKINTITSRGFKDGITLGKKIAGADFCMPVTTAHGHACWLTDKSDYVFAPVYMEENTGSDIMQYCLYTQYVPALIKGVIPERTLMPLVRYLYSRRYVKKQLHAMLKGITRRNIGLYEVSAAYDRMMTLKKVSEKQIQKLGDTLIQNRDDISIVLLGRPYAILPSSIICRITDMLAEQGIATVYQDMLKVEADTTANIKSLLRSVNWHFGTKVLEAAEKTARTRGLYPVMVTCFKCSPDSFVMDYVKAIMDNHHKPYLILELDEHVSGIGYETRIESAIRVFRHHHQSSASALKINPGGYRRINPEKATTLKGKAVVLPNWDAYTFRLVRAVMESAGLDVYLIEETSDTIAKSLTDNSGQCAPVHAITQGFSETIIRNGLDPARTVLWMLRGRICNLPQYPHFIKTRLERYGQGLEKARVYTGGQLLMDISVKLFKHTYFAYMLGGFLRKAGCAIRPYETNKGETDRVLEQGLLLIEAAFGSNNSLDAAVAKTVEMLGAIPVKREKRTKVAIIGDLYVRDNHVMNQDVIAFIEAQGGEVVTTPYTETGKMIVRAHLKRRFNERRSTYNVALRSFMTTMQVFNVQLFGYKAILSTVTMMERKYLKLFNTLLDEAIHTYEDPVESILSPYGLTIESSGETQENVLKAHYLKKHYPDIDLFVQLSPAFCCPSLITEAMGAKIEQQTGIPIVTITYDGALGCKNDEIIPHLAYSGGREKYNAASKSKRF
ncbi:MAG: acyl-CoA dehydratase activase [Thermodesulfobacteriota bacterium]